MGPSQEQAATSRNDTSDSEADNNGDDTPVSGSSSSSSSSSSSEDEADDPVMAELMRENSETSSSYDEDDNDLGEPSVKKEVKRKKIYRQYDAPASNVAVLMVACWTLRLPIIYMDFIRLIEAYELPYLDPIRLLPASLTAHLTKHTAQALSPHHAPTPLHLHRLASRLAKLMYASYAVYTPEMNAAPVLWRAVCGLYGTPTLYILTKKVARVISIPLMLHNSVASPLPRAKQRDPVGHKYDNAVPEVSLLATVIVVLKMVYGLDGRARLPKERDDPACALPRLSDYLTCLKELDEKSAKDEAPFSTTSHSSILDLSEHELDKYLDFCEGALLPREDQQTEQNAATELFPLPSKEVSSKMARIGGKVTELGRSTSLNERSTMSAMSVDSDGKALSPGESYAIFNTLDTLGALPDDYEVIIRRAAHWAGVSEEYVCGVAERYERRLVRWWDGVRKKEREENVE
ncbi:hypothetical protein AcV5_001212 [Taiwanofungus camphoratus]|nr:hypothetical protein AcV5_001212 [Antrodia cinnamomea]